jgi:pimeloyl-ACP methyl ester carboxylesterase
MVGIACWLLGAAGFAGAAGAGLVAFTWWTARRVEAALPPQGRFIEVDGLRVHYVDEGVGPPIVMIHGLGGQIRNFTYALLAPLSRRFRVIALDRPGSGHTGRPHGKSATLDAQAKTVADLVRALNLERPLLVGHSLGGAIALAVALNNPESVGGLALIAPVTHPSDGIPKPFRRLVIKSVILRWIVAWSVATPLSILNTKSVLQALFGPDATPPDFATKGGGLLGLRPRSFYATSTDLMAAVESMPNLMIRYPSLRIPVGILFGTCDRILDPAAHGTALVGKIPGLEIDLVEGGGHMIPISSPRHAVRFVIRVARRMSRQAHAEASLDRMAKRAPTGPSY